MNNPYTLRTGPLDNGARAPAYGDASSLFTIEMHYGGILVKGNFNMIYNGGWVCCFDDCSPENMSSMILIEMASKIGIEPSSIKMIYRREVDYSYRDIFVEVKSDKDAIDLGKFVDEHRVIGLYLETHVLPEMICDDDSSDPDYVGDDDSEHSNDSYFTDEGGDADEVLERFGGSDEEIGIEDDLVGMVNEAAGSSDKNQTIYAFVGDGTEEAILNEGYVESDELNSDESEQEDYAFTRVDLNKVQFKVGMKFESADQFKAAVSGYAIQQGKNVKFGVSSKKKISVKCVDGCQWKAFATKLRDENTFRISSLYDNHTCSRTGENRHCTSRYIAEVFLSRIRNNPKWGLKEFRSEVQSVMKCKITMNKANKALRIARKRIVESNSEQFGRLWDYIDEIKRTNPGTTVVMKVKERGGDQGQPLFKCIYVCWSSLKKGFVEGCRPVIGLDGCHLTGPSKGVLLTAVAIDANNCMYPFAYGVVDIENTKRWKWFVDLLRQDLQLTEDYTFISDKQKGLINALEEVLPGVEHRFCVRHLYNNFKIKHKGLLLKDILWKAARACTIPHFEAALEEMKNLNKEAYDWLKEKPGTHWSRSHFRTLPKCDMLLNNLCESFNSVILDARSKPILNMLEGIREYLMEMVAKKKTAMLRTQGILCPKIQKKLEEIKVKSHEWTLEWNGDLGFEVNGPNGARYAVDLGAHTCGCRRWELSGIPCVHVVSACNYMNMVPEEFVHKCYRKESYMKTYVNVLMPLQGRDLWKKSEKIKVVPPIVSKQIGRPKRARRRDPDERLKQSKNKVQKRSRKGMVLKCRKCGKAGHNKQTCGIPKVPRYNKRKSSSKEQPSLVDDESSSNEDMCEPTVEEPVISANVVSEPVVYENVVITENVIEEPVMTENIVTESVVNDVVGNDAVVNEAGVSENVVVSQIVLGQNMLNEPVINEAVINEAVLSEPMVNEPMVSEPVITETVTQSQAEVIDEELWSQIAENDELWNMNSQTFSQVVTQEASKSKTLKFGIDIKVRRSSRIRNIRKKGPIEVEHVDLTSGDEDEGNHGGIFSKQNTTQQSQSGPSTPPESSTGLHAGIMKPLSPPLPSGHIKRKGKVYLTVQALKKIREEERNKKFMPPRPNN